MTFTDDPTRGEMLEYLLPLASSYEASEFDIEGAIYWFACNYHGGQSSNLYSALSTSPFTPGLISNGPERESVEEMLYQELEMEFAG